jgi:small conductance mechanosensitive channel
MPPVLADVFAHPEEILTQLRDLAPAAAWSAVVLAVTYVISRLLSGRVRAGLERTGFQVNVAILLSRTLWLTLWIVGVLLVLYQFGIGLTPLTAFVGIMGLAASLALQTVLQNLVAGVYLLAERPFAIGDFISVVGPLGVNHEGRVEDIQMRTTHLRSRDGELILVPNSGIFSGVITNRTATGGFVRHLTVTFPRDTDIDDARARILPILSDLPSILPSPEPRLWVDRVGKDDWTACLSLWAASPGAESTAVWAIAQIFPDAIVNDGGTPA